MSATLLNLLAAVIGGGALTAVVAYFVARRQTSGSVSTSDAATIFGASEDIRHGLTAEVLRQAGVIQRLESKLESQEAKVQAQGLEIAKLQARLSLYENGDR